MIRINSELPNCMLKHNNALNEYDFVLFHLYSTNKKYKNYYLKQRKDHPDRLMIFDNSAYEFYVKGETLDMVAYYEAICELQPDLYILPDVLMDKEKTLKGVREFMDLFKLGITMNTKVTPQPLAVAQGDTEDELLECLEEYKQLNINNIAIPFHNSFFKSMAMIVPDEVQEIFTQWHDFMILSEDSMYAMGRVKFMMRHKDILKRFNHVHLLGSHDVIEKGFYGEYDTMDTGYPVKCAIEGYKLGFEPHKPNVIIDEFLDKKLSSETTKLITHNVNIFKML